LIAEVKVTEKLRDFLKTERKKNKRRGDHLAKQIGKSPSYIYHLENGKITKIDFKTFIMIFTNIIQLDRHLVLDYLNASLSHVPGYKKNKGFEDNEDWCDHLLLNYKKSPTDKVEDFLMDTYLVNDRESIKKVLAKEKAFSPAHPYDDYIPAGFIFKDPNTGYIYASALEDQDELDHLIKTIFNRDQTDMYTSDLFRVLILFMSTNESLTFASANTLIVDMLGLTEAEDSSSKHAAKYAQYQQILSYFDALKDFDSSYFKTTLKALEKNLMVDSFLMFSIMKQAYSQLADLNKEDKVAFITDLKALIDFYSGKSGDKSPIID